MITKIIIECPLCKISIKYFDSLDGFYCGRCKKVYSEKEYSIIVVGLDELKKVRDEIIQNQRMVAQQLAEYTDDEDINYKTKRDLIIIGDGKLDTYKLVLNLFDLGLCNSQEQNGSSEGKNAVSENSSVSCEHKTTGDDKENLKCLITSSEDSSPVHFNRNLSAKEWEQIYNKGKPLTSPVQNPKKCTCKVFVKYDDLINNICGRCGGKL